MEKTYEESGCHGFAAKEYTGEEMANEPVFPYCIRSIIQSGNT